MTRNHESHGKIKLPPLRPLTAEERERRRRVVAETLKLREEIGPISPTVPELLREVREGEASW